MDDEDFNHNERFYLQLHCRFFYFYFFHGVDKIEEYSLKKTDYANLHKVVNVIMLIKERPQSI